MTSEPIKSVISTNRNAVLIAAAAQLWIKPTDTVLDMTYGRGLFWTDYKPSRLIANDRYLIPEAGQGVTFGMNADYRAMPLLSESVHVAVFDPPYITTGSKVKTTVPEMHDRYGTGLTGPANIAELRLNLVDGITEAYRVLRPGGRLLVKCMDYIESGRYQQGHLWVVLAAREVGMEQVDEFIHHSRTGPQPLINLDGSKRRQVHSRRAHSFLCVFIKPKGKSRG